MNNIEKLTLGELAKVEELAGAPISHLGNDEKPQFKLMASLAFALKRREDPKFTFKDAMDLTADDLSAILGDLDDDEVEESAEGKD